MAGKIRMLMVDDYPLLRDGVKAGLPGEGDIELIAFCDHTADAINQCAALQPDLLLFAARPHGPIALDEIRSLHEQFPEMKILLMADETQAADALASLRVGVGGVIMKRDPAPLLQLAVRVVHRGTVWLSPSLAPLAAREQEKGPELTAREREVLRLLARGWDNPAIAAELHLEPQTVRNYLSRTYGKIGVSSSAEAIVWAHEHGYGI